MAFQRTRLLWFAATLLTIACGRPTRDRAVESGGTTTCPAGHVAVVSDTLYFGTKKQNPDKSWTTVVTPEVWGQFAATELARAFPDGSTSWVAQGTWKAPDGTAVAETSYVTTLVHPGSPEARQAVTQLMEHYKARYEQKSVLQVSSFVCARF